MIDLARHGDVAALTLKHGKANALDLQLCRALEDALNRGAESPARALVITGTGSIFSAGVDLKRLADGGPAYVREFLPAMESLFRALVAFEKPIVAAINGHAIAGGAVIACGCDVRIFASGNASYGVPELDVGVPFPPAALQLVRLGMPNRLLSDATLRARLWRGEECLAAGLVHEVVEPDKVVPRAIEVAQRLAAVPKSAWRLTKRQLRSEALAAIDRAGAAREDVLAAWCSDEVLDAVRAYVAKTLR